MPFAGGGARNGPLLASTRQIFVYLEFGAARLTKAFAAIDAYAIPATGSDVAGNWDRI
jgi:hypothetical protein